jgi:Mn-dependent DtxR family transcriptional regulator
MRSIAFHQKFKLDRERLAALLRYMTEQPVMSKKGAAAYIGMGQPAVEGMIGWLIKTNLGEPREKGYGLTPFGRLIAAHDPELAHIGTLWLLHYYLVTEHTERSEVWYRAFNEFFTPGVSIERGSLLAYVERIHEHTPKNKTGLAADCNQLWKCYLDPASLGKLNLVREEAQTYTFQLGLAPDTAICAFTLFDTWQRRFPYTDTLRLSQICEEPECLGKVFVAHRDQVVQMLQSLQSLGLVNLADSQHEPVTRRYRDDPFEILTSFYAKL